MDIQVGSKRKKAKGNRNIHLQVITIFLPNRKLVNMFEDATVDTSLQYSYRKYIMSNVESGLFSLKIIIHNQI